MNFLYLKPNLSGIGDRLFDLILIYTYSKYLNCDKLFLHWGVVTNDMVGNNSIFSKKRKEKTPFREFDYLLENLKKYIILPDDIIFVSQKKMNNLIKLNKDYKFRFHLGIKYTLYTFMEKFIKPKKFTEFEKNYFDNFKKIKFQNIPIKICDYFKNNKVITVHLRRGDKVMNEGQQYGIKEDQLSNLNEITCEAINILRNYNFENFNFISDEKKIRDEYISIFKNKSKCQFFDGDYISQTYYDLYSLAHSNIIILSQKFSVFSIFASLINKSKLYYLLDNKKIRKFKKYEHINYFNSNFNKNNCVFCSYVRNVAKYLNRNLKNILSMAKLFSDYYICFFYDKSKDNTLEKLKNFQKAFPDKVKIIENDKEMLKYGTHRNAYARNSLVEYVNNNLNNFEYMIMMDMDNICNYKVNKNILKYHLNLKSWDALSFNRSRLPEGNYDIWALMFEPYIHHCHSYNGCLDVTFKMRKDITKKLNNLKKGELFECYSAFNGISIYRLEKFKNCKYDGEKQRQFSDERINKMLDFLRKTINKDLEINYDFVDKTHGGGKQICEHINFHLSAIRKNNARIRISGESLFEK